MTTTKDNSDESSRSVRRVYRGKRLILTPEEASELDKARKANSEKSMGLDDFLWEKGKLD